MKYFVCLLMFALSCAEAIAQVPSSDEPGRIAERFEQPQAPLSQGGRIVVLPGVVAPEGAGAVVLRIVDVRIVGATVYEDEELRALYRDLIGREVVLAEVYELAQALTARYGDDGYVLSRAIVPPQELDPAGAIVTIEIVEGYVDRVEWPSAAERYRDFFSDYAARITAERPANINTVMRYLLLAGDLPGVDVTSRFQASEATPNASTLIVEMTEKRVDVFAQLDNRGTEPRGPWQYSVNGTFSNLLGVHEALSIGYSGAVESNELGQLTIGYRQVLNSEGLSAFANATFNWGEPGTAPLEALEFRSNSTTLDAGFSFPVIRSRDTNLTLAGLVFASDNLGEMLGATSSDDRLRGVRAKADFDHADTLNGITQGNLTLSHGFEGFGSTANDNPLASRENGQVDFTTLAGSLSRVQRFDSGFSFLIAAEGQYAATPLLSSEECGYGGKSFGRAFDPSEITGDHCWSVSGELRFDPDLPNNPMDYAQLYAFADYGRVYRVAPALGTPDTESGASAGAGVRFGNDNFSADIVAAKPLLGRLDDDWRFFLATSATY